VRTLLPPGPRLFPVGRLDAETSGLIIATNDGELAHHLMHPRYGVRKLYRVRLDRPPDGAQIRRLREGVEFEPRTVSAPCEVRVRNARPERAEIEIVLHEGRYRQVRRMCEAVGLGVSRLHRPSYGPLRLGTLPRGAWRDLSPDEVRRLKAASARPVPRVRRVRPTHGPGEAVREASPRLARVPGPGEAQSSAALDPRAPFVRGRLARTAPGGTPRVGGRSSSWWGPALAAAGWAITGWAPGRLPEVPGGAKGWPRWANGPRRRPRARTRVGRVAPSGQAVRPTAFCAPADNILI